MNSKVIIIDQDVRLFKMVEDAIKKHHRDVDPIKVSTIDNAVKMLKTEPIAVIASVFNTLTARDLAFINYVADSFIDILHIVIGENEPDAIKLVIKNEGNVDYLKKPYTPETVAIKIINILNQQKDGGALYNVSSSMILQIIQMEQRTCTIRILDHKSNKRGALYFMNGRILDAWVVGKRGELAAYEIFSWDNVSLFIQNSCYQTKKRMEGELQAILLEAMRLKDEAVLKKADEPDSSLEEDEIFIDVGEAVSDDLNRLKDRITKDQASKDSILDIYEDEKWNNLLSQARRIGTFFGSGELRVGCVEEGGKQDYLLVPGKQTVVIAIEQRCPRDKLIKLIMS